MENKSILWTQESKFGKKYDIIIVGGGIAGVSAALAGARMNKKVLIIEKGSILGGLATAGLVILYNPPLDDGKGRKLVGGIAEELMHLSVKYSYGILPKCWEYRSENSDGKDRYQAVFSASAFALAMNEIVLNENVDILYEAHFCHPIMDGTRCCAVSVETHAGTWHYEADVFIDCSGDGDLLLKAGVPFCQRRENDLSYWAISTELGKMQAAINNCDIGQAFSIERMGTSPYDKELSDEFYGIETPEEISEFVGKGQILALDELKKYNPKEKCFVSIPSVPEYRKTRSIDGMYTLSEKDRDVYFEDSIGCVKEEFDPYILEIPYRCLVDRTHTNILAAGRLISADGKPRDTVRLIAVCALTGEACGIAASLLCDNGGSIQNINIASLQRVLEEKGNILHPYA